MTDANEISPSVLRAIYQISGFTPAPVTVAQITDVIPLPADQFGPILQHLESQGWIRTDAASESLQLTPQGIQQASTIPPVAEPPLFQDI